MAARFLFCFVRLSVATNFKLLPDFCLFYTFFTCAEYQFAARISIVFAHFSFCDKYQIAAQILIVFVYFSIATSTELLSEF
jgi:hypothetical protein